MKDAPTWLSEAKDLCRKNGIEIAGWGNSALVVYAKSENRAREIALLLANLGFRPVPDQNDAYAGLLTLSRNP